MSQPVAADARRPFAAAGGAVLAAALVAGVLPAVIGGVLPRGIVLQGAEQGAITGLLAVALVLTYRSTRVVNFALGAMGTLPATLGTMLDLGQHWNYWAAITVSLAAGLLVGLLVELQVIRRFARSQRLVVTVATIGVAEILGGIQVFLPGWLGGPPTVARLATPLSAHHVSVAPAIFTGDDLLAVCVIPVVVLALAWFLGRTTVGIAVRAAAENEDRVRLLGIPVRAMSTLVWGLAGLLAALTVTLGAPSQGIVITAASGPQLLLPALAAAVIAGMSSLWLAFGSAVALGTLDAVVRWHVSQQSVSIVVFLGVILVALVARGWRAPPLGGSEGTWGSAGALRALPAAIARHPLVRAGRWAGAAVLAGTALAVALAGDAPTLHLATGAVVFALVAVALNVLTGWSGNVSLGQMAVAGVGGVVTGDLLVHTHVDLFVALVVAALAGSAISIVVGLPALRLQGMYLAVTTLAFALTADLYLYNPVNFPSLLPANVAPPVLWHRFDLGSQRALYVSSAVTLAVALVLVSRLSATRAGRVLRAARDNPRAAAAVGVPVVRARLSGFVVAGALSGLAGGFAVIQLSGVGYHAFPTVDSITVFSMVVVGGIGSLWGALCGAGLIAAISLLVPNVSGVVTGVAVLVLLMFLPGGLAQAGHRVRDLVARRLLRPETAPSEASGPAATAAAVEPEGDADGHLLSCRGLEFSYGPIQVLFGVDLDVGEGEIVALLGTNGAGKSTLLHALSGLSRPGGGTARLGGADIAGLTAERLARRGLSLMPGGRGLFPSLTVDEHLRLGGWMGRSDAAAVERARSEVFELFPVLAERRHQRAGTLSGGEQQMLSLGLSIMTGPRVLLVDELSLGLAPAVVAMLLGVIATLREQGTTIVVVEQSVNVALEVADRAVFLEKGEVRFSGPTQELLERPDVLHAAFLTGSAGGGAPATIRERRPAGAPAATPMLECRDVTKRFGGIQAVDHVDLVVPRGAIVGLIGHNGAGKSTLVNAISGFVRVDGGRIVIDGHDVTDRPPHARARAGLGRSFQDALLFPSLTVEESLMVSMELHLESRDPLAAALGLPASLDSERAARTEARELLERFNLAEHGATLTGDLSTGMRRIVELACVLATRPSLVLLDEPSAGVAQREVEALGPLLATVQRESGCTMVVIEHDMPLLTSLCDELVAMELGAVIAQGPPDQVVADERVIASYLGTEQGAAVQRSGALG